MGYEVEVKYRLVDPHTLVRRLTERGAARKAEIIQEDTYLSHPARDFAATNEAFRVRRAGEENRITYKGPRRSGPTKTREEIEIRFDGGDEARRQMLHLLEKLGFRPVATIRKKRIPFQLHVEGRQIEVVLDQAEGLGDFAEIETLAPAPDDLPAAQAAVMTLANELGLTEVEPRSYLRMALEAAFSARPGLLESADGSPSD
jgi:adenylate cyclase class 2